jgi:hypothetical protein
MLFAGKSFYARGGWLDLVYYNNDDDTPEVLLRKVEELSKYYDWWHIVDTEVNAILYAKNETYCGDVTGLTREQGL